ncbi:hypothetical protein BL1813 [Bifidobacterium longum NCC2705]|uniref:LytR/CpsA/Psr regulator C-terminal domain-containing protein n=1 Tax=Bifidobacterium longum (strain NCC 2705) TaxID=206672 RepID=Q8G3E8_BIFLO|nr:hypothetical protein BL1813 [Bifidobacterium longum NCC2705]
MARDTMTYESYEPDSFDNPPKGPVGVHRGARSVMARLCPFIVVILVAALCGVGAWAWISGEYKNVIGGSSQTATTSKSDSSSKAETKNSTKDDSSSTSTDSSKDSTSDSAKSDTDSDTTSSNENQNSDQQSQQSEATATVNKATQVRVVNATGIQGYAGQQADVLQTAGYTSVEATNPSGTLPASSWCGIRMRPIRPPLRMWRPRLAFRLWSRCKDSPFPLRWCCSTSVVDAPLISARNTSKTVSVLTSME